MTPEPADVRDRDERWSRVLVACLETLESGQAVDRHGLLERYPEFSGEMEQFFADHDCIDRLAAPVRPARPTPDACQETPFPPDKAVLGLSGSGVHPFGDYELLGAIGAGGMGVVYKARHRTLTRLVALKMIRTGLRMAGDVQRFRNEAKTLAGLDHPHIVPIYDVGEYDGQLYFTMKLVEGGSLDQMMRNKQWPVGGKEADRQTARLLAAASRAVHHLHQRGVLHRDLKPSNILLDAAGQPHVTDFGLAKRFDDDGDLSGSDTPVGTPRYMAPEQAAGRRDEVTTATDVYGLGTILYALLTGRAPFVGTEPLDVLNQVKEREPDPPRTLVRGVDRDLETICLKCLQKEPQRRYRSAEELAEDLERWLAGAPITARPINRAERVWRWCARNPGLAIASAVATLSLLAVLVGSPLALVHISKARNAETRAREKAEQGLEDTLAAVDYYFLRVSESPEVKARGTEDLRRGLLEKARDYYSQFVERYGDDPRLQGQLALAYLRLAEITGDIGSKTEAIRLHQQGLKLWDQLASVSPQAAHYQRRVAESYWELGGLFRVTGRLQDAETALLKGLAIHEELVRTDGSDLSLHRLYARSLGSISSIYRDTGRAADAEMALNRSLEIYDQLVRERPDVAVFQEDRAMVFNSLGILYRALGRREKALAALRQARALQHQLVDQHPREPRFREELARTVLNLGNYYYHADPQDFRQAEDAYRQSGDLYAKLAGDHPLVNIYQTGLAQSFGSLGSVYADTGRGLEAEAAFKRALGLQEALVRDHPTVTQDRFNLGVTYGRLGELTDELKNPQNKLHWFEKACATLEEVAKQDRGHALAGPFLYQLRLARGDLLTRMARHAEAVTEWTRLLDSAAEPDRRVFECRRSLSLAYLGEHRRAAESSQSLAGRPGNSGRLAYDLARVYAVCSAQVLKDGSLSSDRRHTLAKEYAAAALAQLFRAQRADFFKDAQSVQSLRAAAEFEPLRTLPDYQKFLLELSRKPKP